MNDNRDEFAQIMCQSRLDAKVSQEYMANELGVSRKTISNWEAGVSAPDVWQFSKWFDAIGKNPFPYIYGYMYPGMKNISGEDSDENIENALDNVIKDLPIQIKRMLLFILYGNHNSVTYSVLNMIVAHLHCSMFSRVNHGITIYNDYKMHEMIGKLSQPNNIKPDLDNLGRAIREGYDSLVDNRNDHIT